MAIVAEAIVGACTSPNEVMRPSCWPRTPTWKPKENSAQARENKCCRIRNDTWADLFTDRQLVALTTFSDLVQEARAEVRQAAGAAGIDDPQAYADAVATYLAFIVDRASDYWSTIATWVNSGEFIRNTFARQAIPMTWDFAEVNPFSDSTGNWSGIPFGFRKF